MGHNKNSTNTSEFSLTTITTNQQCNQHTTTNTFNVGNTNGYEITQYTSRIQGQQVTIR